MVRYWINNKLKLVLLFIALLFSTAFYAQSKEQISPLQIDTTAIVSIGGIQQFISIKGTNRENPILLILHGGPGRSIISAADSFTNKLWDEFTVVNWDQRETGKTLAINSFTHNLTLKQLKDDTVEVINYLRQKFHQEKIYL